MSKKPYKIVNRNGKKYVYEFGKKITLSNGKRKEILAHSASELKVKIREAKLDDEKGSSIESRYMSVADVAKLYLAYRRGLDAPNTHQGREHYLNKYILPALGQMKARKVRAQHIRKFFLDIESEHGSTRVERVNKAFSPMIKWAVLRGAGFTENPIPGDVLARIRDERNAQVNFESMSQTDDIYSADLLLKILTSVEHKPEEIAVHMQALHGLRVGEALAVKFEDIDLESNTVRVNKQVNESPINLRMGTRYASDSYLTITPPKSKGSQRVVPLHERTRLLIESTPERKRAGYVLSTSKGTPISPSNYNNREISRLSRDIGRKLSSHDLRKLYASMSIENGESIVKVSRRLGHKKISTTFDHYAKMIE